MRRCECQRRKAIAGKLAKIPKRFADVRFETFQPIDEQQELAAVQVNRNLTGSFYLHGDYARGKTHLAIAQYRAMVEMERPCMWFSTAELLMELQKASDPDYFCQVRQRVKYADSFHLFIDDIDKHKSTEFRFQALFELIDGIYSRNLGLTVTSNCSLRELSELNVLDNSIIRRIDDICRAVEV